MVLPLYLISSVSRLYRFPPQISQCTKTSGKKCISTLITPSPLQASQRPPFTLKLNLPGVYPRERDSGVAENNSLMGVKSPV